MPSRQDLEMGPGPCWLVVKSRKIKLLPGFKKKRTLSKKMKKYKPTVFYFLFFRAIYKRSSEFWIKVNFSVKESKRVSTLVMRCRVSLRPRERWKAFCSLKIEVRFSKIGRSFCLVTTSTSLPSGSNLVAVAWAGMTDEISGRTTSTVTFAEDVGLL